MTHRTSKYEAATICNDREMEMMRFRMLTWTAFALRNKVLSVSVSHKARINRRKLVTWLIALVRILRSSSLGDVMRSFLPSSDSVKTSKVGSLIMFRRKHLHQCVRANGTDQIQIPRSFYHSRSTGRISPLHGLECSTDEPDPNVTDKRLQQ